ncbi:Ig-like domain-containing protein, partial [Brevibacillus choshinensis]|uniref:Ig-like domain-containing protein n=1 Tax=Brevibacillus choshinensis TaxID=54911 RepID=UPI002E1C568D|nr:Ig-like domain-containing protein [Brevibacillus choshinensis]
GGELKVESVSAINPAEIKVVFNNELDKSSAEKATNYTVTAGGLTAGTAKLQADKKSVVVKLSGNLAVGSTYKVAVANVLDAKYNKVTDFTSSTQVFTDSKAPTLLSGEVDGGALVLTFDEPVKNTMTVKVDGQTVAIASVGTANGDYTATTAALAANLLTAGTHSVVVYDAEDVLAANANKTSIQNTSYTVTADTVAPSVTGVTAISKDKFAVKFSESLKGGLSAANLVVKKGSYTFGAGRFDSVALDLADTTNKTYIVDLNDSDAANPVFATGETSVSLSVTVKGYKDNADLYGAEFNGSVTLTGDAAKPTVLSQNLNSITGAKISIKFSEALASGVALDATKVTVKKNGVIVPLAATPLTLNAVDTSNKTLDIELAAAATAGTYTVVLGAGAVQDLDGNKNDATTTTAAVASAEVALPLVADTDGTVSTVGGVGTNTGEFNVITINYGEDMEDSAAVLSNYKLDGAAFPAGTTIGFYDTKEVVKITLPANYFAIDTTAKLTASRSIKSVAGSIVEVDNVGKAESEVMVSFTDSIAPELTSAKFVLADPTDTTTSTIKLTFNEGINAIAADEASLIDDLVVKVGGNKIAVAGNTAVVTAANEIVFTVATPINLSQGATVDIVAKGSSNAALAITDDSALLNSVKAVSGVTVTK